MDESHSSRRGILSRYLRWLGKESRPEGIPSEIQQVIDVSEEQGLIDEDEGEMIEGIFDLKQRVAREIMIPRTHIVSLPVMSDLQQILTNIIESGHSRIPIYEENVDQIIGILNAKDLLPIWLNGETEVDLKAVCRDPIFVPETKRIKELLDELRDKKSHLAVIVDEYGGTAGIVTIEDIIEEIIGEIRDEHDIEEEPFISQEDGSVLTSARVNVDDFEERFGVTLPRGGYDTLGGFIIHLMGKVPPEGEEIVHSGLRLRVFGGDRKRITRVMVLKEPPPESANGSVHSEVSP